MVGCMGIDEGKQSMPIHDLEDLHAVAALGEAHGVASTRRCRTSRINETFVLIDCAFVEQCVV